MDIVVIALAIAAFLLLLVPASLLPTFPGSGTRRRRPGGGRALGQTRLFRSAWRSDPWPR
jgi:hypothetical protein